MTDNIIDEFDDGRPSRPDALGRGSKAKARTHCNHGHEWTVENTKWQRDKLGRLSRVCLTCRRAYSLSRSKRKSA